MHGIKFFFFPLSKAKVIAELNKKPSNMEGLNGFLVF
tara:strand:- start:470 stop:580 length:111 start_codon:yes stop_codon:yes gene_type:complete